MSNVTEFTKLEQIALGALKAESQRLQQQNIQFTVAVQEVTAEIENNHPGYTLDVSTVTLVAKPVVVIPETAEVYEMPVVAHDSELAAIE